MLVHNNDISVTTATVVLVHNDDFGATSMVMVIVLQDINGGHSADNGTSSNGLAHTATTSSHTAFTHHHLWDILRSNVDSASIEAHLLELDPLIEVTLTRSAEEVEGHSGVTNHVTADHVLISDLNVDFLHNVHDNVLHVVNGTPFGVLALTESGLISPLLHVDLDENERGHTLEETDITVVEVSGVSVHLQQTLLPHATLDNNSVGYHTAANYSLGMILGLEVDVTSGSSVSVKFNPLGDAHRLGEESHWHFSTTDHFTAHHVFVFHDNLNQVVHVKNFKVEKLHGPPWVSTTALNDH